MGVWVRTTIGTPREGTRPTVAGRFLQARVRFSFERFSLTPALFRLERGNCPPVV